MVQMKIEATPEKPCPLRIRFRKIGALQYISHLDLMRTMTRVIVRAGIPVRYTFGFNPIPHLVFSAPLPVGAESPAEFLDIAVTAPVDTGEIMTRLNEGLPSELAVEAVYVPTTKFSDIAFAVYEIRLRTPNADATLAQRCGELLSASPLIVRKHTKSGDKDTDISPAIAACHASYCAETGEICLVIRLCADSGSFLKPAYLMNYLADRLGILQGSPLDEDYTVTRTHLLTKEEKDFS